MLLAHYKLDGNANDSSGNGNHGTPNNVSWEVGKIGQAKGDTGSISELKDVGRIYSISFWINITISSTGSYRKFLQQSSNRSPGFWLHNNNNRLHLRSVLSSTTNAGADTNTSLNTNEWYHIVYLSKESFDGVLLQSYVNGILEGNFFYSGETVNVSGTEIELLQQSCLIDDVRIYNHVLSLKEIKELAKAKILHYTFDDFQEPTENLFDSPYLIPSSDSHYWYWGSSVNTDGKYAVLVNTNTGNNRGIVFDFQGLAVGDTITKTIRFRWKSGENSFACTSTDFSDTTRKLNGLVQSTTIHYDEGRWHTYTITGTATSTSPRMRFYPLGDSETEIMHMQFEKKPHATPFTETTREGIVKDSSGYNNHAELSLATTPRWTEDSKIGSGAYEFDGSKNIITEKLFLDNTNQEWTCCAWVKLDAIVTGNQQLNNFNLGNRIVHSTSNGKALLYANSGVNDHYVYSSGSMFTNEWFHIAFVYRTSDKTCKILLNGVLDASTTNWSEGNVPSGFASDTIFGSNLEGILDDVRVYATALSDDDIKELYQQRASLDDKGNFFVHNAEEYTNWNEDIQNHNLLENGSQEFESNYNFTSMTYDSNLHCLRRTSGSAGLIFSQFIPIHGNGLNSWDQYRLQGEIKGEDYASRYYFMTICYNKYFQMISNLHVNVRSGTATTLTQDLNPGDTWVYMDNISNWYDDGTTNYSHIKTLAVWHPNDEYLFTPYIYTRRTRRVVEVDKPNNRIRLESSYSGDVIPSGSPAQNHRSGGTYSYIAASNLWTDLENWVFRSGDTSTTASVGNMRYGSSYIRVGFLMNRNAVGGTPTTLVKNMKFYNLEKSQMFFSDLNVPRFEEKGIVKSSVYSEVDIAEGLVAWYPFNGNVKDKTEFKNDGTIVGSPAWGIGPSGKTNALGFEINGSDLVETTYVLDYSLEFTVSAWVYITQADNWHRTVDLSTGDYPGLIGRHSNNSGFFSYRKGDDSVNPWYYNISNYASLTNEWTLITVSKENDGALVTLKAYVNGILSNSITTADINQNYSGTIKIGGSSSNRKHPGLISDPRIYNRALSQEEINVIYELTGNPEKLMKMDSNNRIFLQGELKEV